MRRSLLCAAALTALTLPALATGPLVGPAAAAAPRCDGKAATIVGSPSMKYLRGTAGDDVIVNNGSERVFGSGGDDVICMNKPSGSRGGDKAYGDSGDDRILITHGDPDVKTGVFLGGGDDTLRGGPGTENVKQPDDLDEQQPGGQDVDDIRTGGGNDLVVYPGPHDRVRLGDGVDEVTVPYDRIADDGLLDGGQGRDLLTIPVLFGQDDAPQDRVIDAAAKTLSVSSETRITWTSFADFMVGRPGTVRFKGSAHSDGLTVDGNITDVDVRAAGGDDTVALAGLDRGNTSFRVDGGSGRDLLAVNSPGGETKVDLREHTVSYFEGTGTVERVEDANGAGRKVVLRGDDHDNRLGLACANGRELLAVGRGGADTLLRVPTPDSRGETTCEVRLTLRGDGGPDRLFGSDGRDRLIGGPGTDVAHGRGGKDVCVAERKFSC